MQLYQGTGDIQPQAAAFRGTGAIASDKAFHQLVRVDIQLVPGDVFDGNEYRISAAFDGQINSRMGLGILAGVA